MEENNMAKVGSKNRLMNIDQKNIVKPDKGWNVQTFNNKDISQISEKDGTKAVNLTYKEKLQFIAYTKQVAHGKYRQDVSPEVGFLDVVGNDRR